jgi:antitoxin StbD
MKQILASYSASISELKKNPTALLNAAEGSPIAILNHNKPAAYLIPAETYEALLEKLEDSELAEIVKERLAETEEAISVSFEDLPDN